MYGVVLAAMVTMGGDVPEWGKSCRGCYGCAGNAFSCGGCYGCFGGCVGWSCGGCYGGCTGYYSCHGCYGGCTGYYSCHGCYGGCTGYYSCHGCVGGSCHGCHGVIVTSPYHPRPVGPAPTPKTSSENRATVVVQLPANTSLFVQDQPMTARGTSYTFVSPPLQPGKEYTYKLTAVTVTGGKSTSQEREVTVAAGKTVRVSFVKDGKAGQGSKEVRLAAPDQ